MPPLSTPESRINFKKRRVSIFYKGCAAAGVVFSLLASPVRAENNDAAGAVLCLSGVIAGGTASGDCGGYLAKYFAIVPMRHGHPDFSAMIRERNNFTEQCDSCPAETRQSVSDHYGNKMGL